MGTKPHDSPIRTIHSVWYEFDVVFIQFVNSQGRTEEMALDFLSPAIAENMIEAMTDYMKDHHEDPPSYQADLLTANEPTDEPYTPICPECRQPCAIVIGKSGCCGIDLPGGN